jgi:hypothetical protein
MSALTAVVQVGTSPPLGGGIEPEYVAHLYGGEWPRFVLYAIRPAAEATGTIGDATEATGSAAGPVLDRLPGTYAPAFEAERSYPLTDLVLASAPERSAVGGRLAVLDTKARANYGVSFRGKVLDSDVARGSPAYGRLFEARSLLEAHPYEGAIVLALQPGLAPVVEAGLRENAARLDSAIDVLDAGSARRTER